MKGIEERVRSPIQVSRNVLSFLAVAKGTTPGKVIEVIGATPARSWRPARDVALDIVIPSIRGDDVIDLERGTRLAQAILAHIPGA